MASAPPTQQMDGTTALHDENMTRGGAGSGESALIPQPADSSTTAPSATAPAAGSGENSGTQQPTASSTAAAPETGSKEPQSIAAAPREAALSPTMRDVPSESSSEDNPPPLEHPRQQSDSVLSSKGTTQGSSTSSGSAVTSADPAAARAAAAGDSSDSDADEEHQRAAPTQGEASGTKQDEGAVSSSMSESGAVELDANGLTPLQRFALEQSSAAKEKGCSCHQCKTTKDGSVLLFCANRAEKGRKKRSCRKKYCDACLRRAYNMSLNSMTQAEIDDWQCPACQGKCVCAACARKAEQAVQNSQKLAAVAALQNTLLPQLAGFGGFQFPGFFHGGPGPNMALMQMQMAAAAANINAAAAVPVPAIVAPGPPPVAQPATTLASTTDIQPLPLGFGLPPASVLPLPPQAGPYTFAPPPPPPVSTGVVLASVAEPKQQQQTQRTDSQNEPPQLQHQPLQPPPQLSPNSRARAYSCPSSPNRPNVISFAFPPPPLVAQQSHGAMLPPPSHPKQAGLPLPSRALELQPSHDARLGVHDVSETAPHRRRRHSLKVTPMGTTSIGGGSRPRSTAASKHTSRTNSPHRPGDLFTLQHESRHLQNPMHHQDGHVDFSLPGAFSHGVSISDISGSSMRPSPDQSPHLLQLHSAPTSPSPRSRRGSNSSQAAVYGAPLTAGDLSVKPESGLNSAQNSPARRGSGQDQLLISPLQTQLSNGSLFNLAQRQLQQLQLQQQQQQQQQLQSHAQSSPQLGSNGQMVGASQQLYSPPHLSQAMLMSPPHAHGSASGFQVSPHVSPQHQHQHQQLSLLSSYLQQQSQPLAYSSPSNQQGNSGLLPELDMLQAQALLDGASMGMDSGAATQAVQRLIQQQQLQLHRGGASMTHDLHPSLDDPVARADAINQLQRTLQSVINAKTGQQHQPLGPQALSQQHGADVPLHASAHAFPSADGVSSDLLNFHGGGDVAAGVPPPFDPFSTQELTASVQHDPPSFGSDHGAPHSHSAGFSFMRTEHSPAQHQAQQQHLSQPHQAKYGAAFSFLSGDEDGHAVALPHPSLPASAAFPAPSPPSNTGSSLLAGGSTGFHGAPVGSAFDAPVSAHNSGGGAASPSAMLDMTAEGPTDKQPHALQQAEFAAFS